MIDYVGVISRQDAELLRWLASDATRILEFGAGASTQIFAAYCPGDVETVESDPAWIEKTRRNLAALKLEKPIKFHDHAGFRPCSLYDLIFVDGPDEFRLSFALLTWPALAVGGVMAFHDTRRTKPHGPSPTTDVQNVCAVVCQNSTEVRRVDLNIADSNTTLIIKRAPLLYIDWMQTEGRTPAQMGLE